MATPASKLSSSRPFPPSKLQSNDGFSPFIANAQHPVISSHYLADKLNTPATFLPSAFPSTSPLLPRHHSASTRSHPLSPARHNYHQRPSTHQSWNANQPDHQSHLPSLHPAYNEPNTHIPQLLYLPPNYQIIYAQSCPKISKILSAVVKVSDERANQQSSIWSQITPCPANATQITPDHIEAVEGNFNAVKKVIKSASNRVEKYKSSATETQQTSSAPLHLAHPLDTLLPLLHSINETFIQHQEGSINVMKSDLEDGARQQAESAPGSEIPDEFKDYIDPFGDDSDSDLDLFGLMGVSDEIAPETKRNDGVSNRRASKNAEMGDLYEEMGDDDDDLMNDTSGVDQSAYQYKLCVISLTTGQILFETVMYHWDDFEEEMFDLICDNTFLQLLPYSFQFLPNINHIAARLSYGQHDRDPLTDLGVDCDDSNPNNSPSMIQNQLSPDRSPQILYNPTTSTQLTLHPAQSPSTHLLHLTNQSQHSSPSPPISAHTHFVPPEYSAFLLTFPRALSWHPTETLIAVGYLSGKVVIYNVPLSSQSDLFAISSNLDNPVDNAANEEESGSDAMFKLMQAAQAATLANAGQAVAEMDQKEEQLKQHIVCDFQAVPKGSVLDLAWINYNYAEHVGEFIEHEHCSQSSDARNLHSPEFHSNPLFHQILTELSYQIGNSYTLPLLQLTTRDPSRSVPFDFIPKARLTPYLNPEIDLDFDEDERLKWDRYQQVMQASGLGVKCASFVQGTPNILLVLCLDSGQAAQFDDTENGDGAGNADFKDGIANDSKIRLVLNLYLYGWLHIYTKILPSHFLSQIMQYNEEFQQVENSCQQSGNNSIPSTSSPSQPVAVWSSLPVPSTLSRNTCRQSVANSPSMSFPNHTMHTSNLLKTLAKRHTISILLSPPPFSNYKSTSFTQPTPNLLSTPILPPLLHSTTTFPTHQLTAQSHPFDYLGFAHLTALFTKALITLENSFMLTIWSQYRARFDLKKAFAPLFEPLEQHHSEKSPIFPTDLREFAEVFDPTNLLPLSELTFGPQLVPAKVLFEPIPPIIYDSQPRLITPNEMVENAIKIAKIKQLQQHGRQNRNKRADSSDQSVFVHDSSSNLSPHPFSSLDDVLRHKPIPMLFTQGAKRGKGGGNAHPRYLGSTNLLQKKALQARLAATNEMMANKSGKSLQQSVDSQSGTNATITMSDDIEPSTAYQRNMISTIEHLHDKKSPQAANFISLNGNFNDLYICLKSRQNKGIGDGVELNGIDYDATLDKVQTDIFSNTTPISCFLDPQFISQLIKRKYRTKYRLKIRNMFDKWYIDNKMTKMQPNEQIAVFAKSASLNTAASPSSQKLPHKSATKTTSNRKTIQGDDSNSRNLFEEESEVDLFRLNNDDSDECGHIFGPNTTSSSTEDQTPAQNTNNTGSSQKRKNSRDTRQSQPLRQPTQSSLNNTDSDGETDFFGLNTTASSAVDLFGLSDDQDDGVQDNTTAPTQNLKTPTIARKSTTKTATTKTSDFDHITPIFGSGDDDCDLFGLFGSDSDQDEVQQTPANKKTSSGIPPLQQKLIESQFSQTDADQSDGLSFGLSDSSEGGDDESDLKPMQNCRTHINATLAMDGVADECDGGSEVDIFGLFDSSQFSLATSRASLQKSSKRHESSSNSHISTPYAAHQSIPSMSPNKPLKKQSLQHQYLNGFETTSSSDSFHLSFADTTASSIQDHHSGMQNHEVPNQATPDETSCDAKDPAQYSPSNNTFEDQDSVINLFGLSSPQDDLAVDIFSQGSKFNTTSASSGSLPHTAISHLAQTSHNTSTASIGAEPDNYITPTTSLPIGSKLPLKTPNAPVKTSLTDKPPQFASQPAAPTAPTKSTFQPAETKQESKQPVEQSQDDEHGLDTRLLDQTMSSFGDSVFNFSLGSLDSVDSVRVDSKRMNLQDQPHHNYITPTTQHLDQDATFTFYQSVENDGRLNKVPKQGPPKAPMKHHQPGQARATTDLDHDQNEGGINDLHLGVDLFNTSCAFTIDSFNLTFSSHIPSAAAPHPQPNTSTRGRTVSNQNSSKQQYQGDFNHLSHCSSTHLNPPSTVQCTQLQQSNSKFDSSFSFNLTNDSIMDTSMFNQADKPPGQPPVIQPKAQQPQPSQFQVSDDLSFSFNLDTSHLSCGWTNTNPTTLFHAKAPNSCQNENLSPSRFDTNDLLVDALNPHTIAFPPRGGLVGPNHGPNTSFLSADLQQKPSQQHPPQNLPPQPKKQHQLKLARSIHGSVRNETDQNSHRFSISDDLLNDDNASSQPQDTPQPPKLELSHPNPSQNADSLRISAVPIVDFRFGGANSSKSSSFSLAVLNSSPYSLGGFSLTDPNEISSTTQNPSQATAIPFETPTSNGQTQPKPCQPPQNAQNYKADRNPQINASLDSSALGLFPMGEDNDGDLGFGLNDGHNRNVGERFAVDLCENIDQDQLNLLSTSYLGSFNLSFSLDDTASNIQPQRKPKDQQPPQLRKKRHNLNNVESIGVTTQFNSSEFDLNESELGGSGFGKDISDTNINGNFINVQSPVRPSVNPHTTQINHLLQQPAAVNIKNDNRKLTKSAEGRGNQQHAATDTPFSFHVNDFDTSAFSLGRFSLGSADNDKIDDNRQHLFSMGALLSGGGGVKQPQSQDFDTINQSASGDNRDPNSKESLQLQSENEVVTRKLVLPDVIKFQNLDPITMIVINQQQKQQNDASEQSTHPVISAMREENSRNVLHYDKYHNKESFSHNVELYHHRERKSNNKLPTPGKTTFISRHKRDHAGKSHRKQRLIDRETDQKRIVRFAARRRSKTPHEYTNAIITDLAYNQLESIVMTPPVPNPLQNSTLRNASSSQPAHPIIPTLLPPPNCYDGQHTILPPQYTHFYGNLTPEHPPSTLTYGLNAPKNVHNKQDIFYNVRRELIFSLSTGLSDVLVDFFKTNLTAQDSFTIQHNVTFFDTHAETYLVTTKRTFSALLQLFDNLSALILRYLTYCHICDDYSASYDSNPSEFDDMENNAMDNAKSQERIQSLLTTLTNLLSLLCAINMMITSLEQRQLCHHGDLESLMGFVSIFSSTVHKPQLPYGVDGTVQFDVNTDIGAYKPTLTIQDIQRTTKAICGILRSGYIPCLPLNNTQTVFTQYVTNLVPNYSRVLQMGQNNSNLTQSASPSTTGNTDICESDPVEMPSATGLYGKNTQIRSNPTSLLHSTSTSANYFPFNELFITQLHDDDDCTLAKYLYDVELGMLPSENQLCCFDGGCIECVKVTIGMASNEFINIISTIQNILSTHSGKDSVWTQISPLE